MKTSAEEVKSGRQSALSAASGTPTTRRRVEQVQATRIIPEPVQALLVLFTILSIAFFPALWGRRTLLSSAHAASIFISGAYGSERLPPMRFYRTPDPGAPAWQFEPDMAFIHNQLFKQHHLPLWNPYAGYGAPWAAGMLSQPFYPPSLLLSFHPTPRTVSWFLVLRLLLAGFFAYLYLRYFLPHAAALVGGIVFMLTGYFILYINIDHLSTEVLLPMAFYGLERLLRESSIKSKLIAVGSVYLAIVAGMPECTFLIIFYASAYFLYRLLTARQFRLHFARHFSDFAVSNVLGAALTAFLLLPFFEFLRNGLDSHRSSIIGIYPGLQYLHASYKELAFYLFPLAIFPPFDKIAGFSGQLFGYFGLIAAVLAILGLLSVLPFRRQIWVFSDRLVVLFFFVSAGTFLLKFFGNPAVNWIGALPGFNMILLEKYIQPLLGFAVAALAAFGAACVFERRTRPLDIICATLAALTVTALCFSGFRKEIAALPPQLHFFELNLTVEVAGLLLLCGAMVCCLASYNSPWNLNALGRRGVIALLTLELLGNFIYPVFYRFQTLPPNRLNPYRGAPYIQYLQRFSGDYFRVFARDDLLYPNWSSTFGLYDVRYVYGVNWDRFLFFIRSFLASGHSDPTGDLTDRFTGGGAYESYFFRSWKEKRFLQLSSIRYLVSKSGFNSNVSPEITEVLTQNRQRIVAEKLHVSRTIFSIEGQPRDVLFAHPPTHRLQLATTISGRKPVLTFSPALDPSVYGSGCGDGVEFTVELRDAAGRIKPLYDQYIDPKHNPAERRWLDQRIDLSRYGGQQLTLLFSTSGGPKGDTACDWAGWGGLQMTGRRPAPPASASVFHEMYKREVIISQYDDALPRASVFYAADLVKSYEEALKRLVDPGLDVWQRLVLVSPDYQNRDTVAALQQLAANTGIRAQPASIVSYDSQRVVIHATLEGPGIVMLTDSNYPGWNAYLDGRRVPILAANYLFRGVVAPAGSHTIEFRYEPNSYFYGGLISLCALLLVLAWAVGPQRGRAYCSRLKQSMRNRTPSVC